MPFTEYLGSGKQKRNLGSMESRWDAAWEHKRGEESCEQLKKHETWGLISTHLHPPPGRMLEAGCGLSQWVNLFKREGYDAYGIDYSAEAIDNSLKVWPGLNLTRGDIRDMPYEDDFFDGIVSLGAIEHDKDGPEAMLAEMRRVLRKGGIMFCSVPCYNLLRRFGLHVIKRKLVCSPTVRKLFGREPGVQFFQYVFTPSEYTAIIEKAGFKMIRLVPMTPPVGWVFGRSGGIWRKFIQSVHRRVPWLMPHMMAAICRKE